MDKSIHKGLSGNQLKVIAAIAMTIDHIGVMIFPEIELLRIIGRLALPIFAYMIAEGCVHTKNRLKYALTLFSVALLCQVVYFVAMRSLEQCILMTFLMSVLLIFSYDMARKKRSFVHVGTFIVAIVAVFAICEVIPIYINGFSVDYGFFGAVLPLLIYTGRTKNEKLLRLALGLLFITLVLNGVQGYSMLAIIPLYFYNSKRGKLRMKYFFYIYYPLHLGVIHLISML